MNHNSEIKDKLQLFLNTVRYQTSISVKTFRINYGFDYINTEIKLNLDKFGKKHEISVLYTLK